jgi:hypothetical protein
MVFQGRAKLPGLPDDKTPGLASRSTTITARTDARFRCCFRKETRSLSGRLRLALADCDNAGRRTVAPLPTTDRLAIRLASLAVSKATDSRRPTLGAGRKALGCLHVAKRSYQVASSAPRACIDYPRFSGRIRWRQRTRAFTHNEWELEFQTKKCLVRRKTPGSSV